LALSGHPTKADFSFIQRIGVLAIATLIGEGICRTAAEESVSSLFD
jgi:phosphoribosylpyrophosphate synthetase